MTQTESKQEVTKMTDKPAADRRDVPVGVPLDLSTPVEWHELPKYNGIQVEPADLAAECSKAVYLGANLSVCDV